MNTSRTDDAFSAGSKIVLAYKAFDRDLSCRGHKFQVGETYKHEGTVEVCASDFHACTNPLDVWNYYDLCEGTRYALVEMKEPVVENDGDSQIASAEITIKAELKLPEFIKSAVDFVLDLCKPSKDESVQSASGHYAQLAASGHYAQLAASGRYAKLAASGHYAKLAASGDYAKLAASGDYAKLAASGHSAQLAASGEDSVIASSSRCTYAKGIVGTWISLAEYDINGKCIGFATGCVDGEEIPADTWLVAKNGKLVAA